MERKFNFINDLFQPPTLNYTSQNNGEDGKRAKWGKGKRRGRVRRSEGGGT
jgi:hypothetical protein